MVESGVKHHNPNPLLSIDMTQLAANMSVLDNINLSDHHVKDLGANVFDIGR
jgi:hypothetical protein